VSLCDNILVLLSWIKSVSRKMTLEEFSTLNIFSWRLHWKKKDLVIIGFEDFVLVRWDKKHCEGIYNSLWQLYWDKV
jgi:hypothetical protein